MGRFGFACLLAFALPFAARATVATTTIPLSVGEATLQFPLEPGYVRVSEGALPTFRVIEAALPPRNRLLEGFYTKADIERLNRGEVVHGVYYAVQTLRIAESKQIGLADWKRMRKEMSASMARVDLNAAADRDAAGRRERLSRVTGEDIDVGIGKTAAPEVYRETATSVRFATTMPGRITSGGKTVEIEIATAGAIVLARNKLLYVYAYVPTSPTQGRADVRRALDASVDRLVVLNPSDPETSSSPDVRMGVLLPFDGRDLGWSIVALCVLALVLALVLFFLSRRNGERRA